MKCLLTISLFVFTLPTIAQVHDHVLSFGFDTEAFDVHAIGDGRWLATGRGTPTPNGVFLDTIVAIIFNSDGKILLRKRLDLPQAEVHTIRSVTTTPEGGFVMAIENELCDAGFNDISIYAFDAIGDLVWSKHSPNGYNAQPYLLKITPDSNLLGVQRNQFIKLDIKTGDTIWIAPMLINDTEIHIRDLLFYQNKEDLIVAVGYQRLIYFTKISSSNEPKYLVDYNTVSQTAAFEKVVAGPWGQYFTIDSYTGKLLLFYLWSSEAWEVADYPFRINDIMVRNNGYLVLLVQNDSGGMLLRVDFQGQITSTLAEYDFWRTPKRFDIQNNQLAVVGVGGSGPPFQNLPWLTYNANHFWIQTKPLLTIPPVPPFPNVALTSVQQESPLSITPKTHPWTQEIYYDIGGGQFRVEVTNTGSDTIRQVDILTGFDFSQYFICYHRPVNFKRFVGINLAPGASVELTFGDIAADYQSEVPTQVCFWTASPNEKPDANHNDDLYCHNVPVAVSESHQNPLHLYPNPAESGFWVQTPSDAPCNLFDVSGRLIQAVHVPAVDQPVFIPVGNLPNGLYFLRQGAFVEKIMVQHDR